MTSPTAFRPAFADQVELRIVREPNPAPALYRECYQSVGRDYHWRDRWDWTDEEIARHLAQPGIHLFVAREGDALIGWYELREVGEEASVEIAYFGLVGGATGRGLGKHLLSCAIRDAWAIGPRRVWLHTCTLDHPAALPNYVARGFVPYREEVYEVD